MATSATYIQTSVRLRPRLSASPLPLSSESPCLSSGLCRGPLFSLPASTPASQTLSQHILCSQYVQSKYFRTEARSCHMSFSKPSVGFLPFALMSRTPNSHNGLVRPHITWAQHPFDLMSHSVLLAPSALATRAYLLTLNIPEIFLL